MIDKIGPAPRHKIGQVIGKLTGDEMTRLSLAIAAMLGLAA